MDSGILSARSVNSSNLQLLIKMENKLLGGSSKLTVQYSISDILVNFLFSEASLEAVVMYSEYSFQTACASVVFRYFLTLVLPISVN